MIDDFNDFWSNLKQTMYDLAKNKTNYDFWYHLPLNIENKEFEKKVLALGLDNTLLKCYNRANGFRQNWVANYNSSIIGKMEFLKMEQVLRDWKDNLYYKEDVLQNDLIQYYKPFDLVSETFSCGFLLTPDFISKSIYCHNAPDPETHSLDIDFSGYMIMAKEALIFQYWPKVLLDIQSGEESVETSSFKEHMPKLKEDFSWNAFVEKYESLRLSKRSK